MTTNLQTIVHHTSIHQTTIHELIAARAAYTPQAIAIKTTQGANLNYSQLNHQIIETIDVLRKIGLGSRDRVAVVLPNGAEMAVAFLAIASCVTCAPLNPNYQAAEFEFYLNDLNARALVILAGMDSPARKIAQARQIPIIELVPLPTEGAGRFQCLIASQDDWVPVQANPSPSQPEDIALVLHTSGTTARPKIVPLTHANLCASARNIAKTLGLTETDRSLNVMPLFHIHGLIGVLLASLSVGGSVVCTAGFEAAEFTQWLVEHQPTWYSAVPTIHQAVLSAAVLSTLEEHNLSNLKLRFLRSSSAAMPKPVLTALETVFKVPVIEAYGMTEAAHQMASNPLPPAQRKPGSVGLAAGPEIAIMDEAGQLLKPGEVGEVVIRGANVTIGYDQNPEANAKAFTHGWFRTGDQGSIDAEGYLFLQGRLKEIINRGGEKIVPLEIDACLMEMPAVHQAVAFAVPHPTLGEDIAAAVVLKPGASATPAELRAFLFEQVAAFKVPSQIILLDAIPKGPTGKLQRLGLAKQLASQLKVDYIAPRNDIEQAIAGVMTQVLGRDTIGIEENFFIMGGDSLRGIQVVSRLSHLFGLNLPNIILFQHPTIAQLATEVSGLKAQNSAGDEVQELLNEMEGLSLAEIDRMLAEAVSR